MRAAPQETWSIRKDVVNASGGLVAAQHVGAAEVGADVLAAGGNAVDAALATSLALGVLEPWMSGLGGGGVMIVAKADGAADAIDFGMVAPARLDPAAYPLVEGRDDELFGWPAVLERRNLLGPLSIAVPGQAAGLGLAHRRHASMPWADLCAPAIALARRGLPVTWHTTLRIAAGARDLAEFDAARAIYLPDGVPPAPQVDGELAHLPLGRLADTLERLAAAGPEDLCTGELARLLARDVEAAGGVLDLEDLGRYRARCGEPLLTAHGGATFATPGGLTAGPTFARALALIAERVPRGAPGPAAYAAWAEALLAAYRERLATMGDVEDRRDPACTTHLCVVDRAGTMVSLTQTLLSPFGSRVVSPSTGILLNNGVMWFDPRPGRPNSMAPGKRPLSNMCPVVATAGRRALAGARRVGRAAHPAGRAADRLDARGLRPRPGERDAPAADRRLRRRRGHRRSAPRARGAGGAARPVPGPRGRAPGDAEAVRVPHRRAARPGTGQASGMTDPTQPAAGAVACPPS